MKNRYCEALAINVPVLDLVKDHPAANTYSLLIVALLERGEPMTLVEVAERFETARVSSGSERSSRCNAVSLHARPSTGMASTTPSTRMMPTSTFGRSDSGFVLRRSRGSPSSHGLRPFGRSQSEAHDRRAGRGLAGGKSPELVLAAYRARRSRRPRRSHGTRGCDRFVEARIRYHLLAPDTAKFRRRGSSIRVLENGRWDVARDPEALSSARKGVRDRHRGRATMASLRSDPTVIEANRRASERRRAEHQGPT